MCAMYMTACSLVEHSLHLDGQPAGFFEHCPFFCYQVFVCASVMILKVLSNGFFRALLDVEAGTKLIEAAIGALRKMSVVNNDLPARLGDVIGFFCALPDMTAIGGVTVEDVQLKQVTNRLSMSVVYDCLWTWRKYFATMEREEQGRGGEGDIQDKHSCRVLPGMLLTAPSLRVAGGLDDVQDALGLDFALESWDFLI